MADASALLLDRIQRSIPLSPSPFAELGAQIGRAESEVLSSLARLKEEKIIRQISGIFDAVSLGYESALVAMRISPERIDRAVEAINRHPGVSHNYLRDHPYNLWFTLTVLPNGHILPDHLETLSQEVGSVSTLQLPALRLFKIGVRFPSGEAKNPSPGPVEDDSYYNEASRPSRPLMPWERKIVLALQEDLPLVPRPFLELAKEASLEEEVLLEAGERLKREGFLRRFAAVLRHQNVGFKTNIMTVWEIPEGRVDEVGQKFAQCPFVSHCYLRPTASDWPYNLFAMIHGRGPEECDAQVEKLKDEAKTERFALLKTLHEFKKVRTRYFTGDQEEWERKYLRTDQIIPAMRASGRSNIRTVLPT